MLHILYIDDEPDLLELCKIFLENSGEFGVDTVASPRGGLEELNNKSFDAVICDYQMPGMDGITLLKTLRSTGCKIPFILFTGRGREEVVIQALNHGADFYLLKGGDPQAQFAVLAHKIRQAVGKRKADELVRETNVYLTNLITDASNPIVTWGTDLRITRFNRAFEKLTGFSEAQVLGQEFDILFPDATRASSLDLICRALSGEKRDSLEIPVRTVDGETRIVIWNSANIYAPDGSPVATVAQGTDITERKKAELRLQDAYEDLAATEEALRTANRKISLLSSITRHDILNKIMIIDGYLSIIRQGISTPEMTGYFDKLESAAGTIRSQVEFTRVYENLGNGRSFWQNIHKIISGASVPETIRYHADLEGVEVYADPMLEKVFSTLLDNTLQHGRTVSQVRISCTESANGLTIFFEDDGTGIPGEEKERIFEYGYGKNTGLGLFLAREILAITGIGICETGIPGKGARFELSVPKGRYRLPDSP